MRKIDVEDFDIKIEPEDLEVGISQGIATYRDIKVYFSIVRLLDSKSVHVDNPDVLESLGISESELEREVLDNDRG